MKTTKILVILLTAITGAGFFLLSCNKSTSTGTGMGHLQVMLTDGPASYDAVYIDVDKVEVNVSSDSGAKSGWQTVPLLRPGVYNLLKFSNGIDTVLAATDQLVEHQRVDDDTWALLAQHFDGPQLLEVLFVAGTYVCFAMVCNSAGLQPDPAGERVDAPELPDPPT